MLSSGDSTKFYVGWLRLPEIFEVRDGPLENITKKIFAQGKIKWKKIHARQLTLKNIHAMA